MELIVEVVQHDVIVPERAHETDSGLDVYANNVKKILKQHQIDGEYIEIEKLYFPLTLKPNERALIGTGIACTVGNGFEIQVRPRSGLALKHGITVLNSPGTIDESYTGEICVILINHSNKVYEINKDDRIAQLVVAPVVLCDVEVVESLKDTQRSSGGFGSTGD